MSSQFTTQEIQERFASLPDDLQIIISQPETARRIEDIGRARGLRIDAIGTLIEYSGLVMLGLVKSTDFVSVLERELSVSREQAEMIAVDIDGQVFSRIRNSLQEMQYQSTTSERFDPAPTEINYASSVQQVVPQTPLEPDFEKAFQDLGESSPESPVEESLAPADYDPALFGEHVSSTQTSPLVPARSSTLEPDASVTPEPFNVQTEINQEPALSRAPTIPTSQAPYSANENQAYQKSAQSVINKMPGAVRDAYAQRAQAVPAPQVDQSVLKDFKTRLEEQMAAGNNTAVNNDPYKESI